MDSCSHYFQKFSSLQPLDLAFTKIFISLLLFWYQYLIRITCYSTSTITKTLIRAQRDKWLAMHL